MENLKSYTHPNTNVHVSNHTEPNHIKVSVTRSTTSSPTSFVLFLKKENNVLTSDTIHAMKQLLNTLHGTTTDNYVSGKNGKTNIFCVSSKAGISVYDQTLTNPPMLKDFKINDVNHIVKDIQDYLDTEVNQVFISFDEIRILVAINEPNDDFWWQPILTDSLKQKGLIMQAEPMTRLYLTEKGIQFLQNLKVKL